MSTDDEKSRIAKLLEGLQEPDIKPAEKCSELIKIIHEQFDKEVEEEFKAITQDIHEEVFENPYKVDKKLLEETDRKLHELQIEYKRLNRAKKEKSGNLLNTDSDPKRPWRTNSNKERLLRINNELKHHQEKGSQMILPLDEGTMKNLIQECRDEGSDLPKVSAEILQDAVVNSKKDLPNFQYKIYNSTATAILPTAHTIKEKEDNPNIQMETMTTASLDIQLTQNECAISSQSIMQCQDNSIANFNEF